MPPRRPRTYILGRAIGTDLTWRSQPRDGRRFRKALITFPGRYTFICNCVISIWHSASRALLRLRFIEGRVRKRTEEKLSDYLSQRCVPRFRCCDVFVLAICQTHHQQSRLVCFVSTAAPTIHINLKHPPPCVIFYERVSSIILPGYCLHL